MQGYSGSSLDRVLESTSRRVMTPEKREVEQMAAAYRTLTFQVCCCCWCIQPALFAGTGHFLDRPVADLPGLWTSLYMQGGVWEVMEGPGVGAGPIPWSWDLKG